MTFLSPSDFQLPSLHPVDVTFSDKKPQGLPALEMWFTIDFFFQTYLNYGLFGLVYINHSSILWWFRCLLVFWMHMWLILNDFFNYPRLGKWMGMRMSWWSPRSRGKMLIIIRHHSYMLNHVFLSNSSGYGYGSNLWTNKKWLMYVDVHHRNFPRRKVTNPF